jgi:hypothetical protein
METKINFEDLVKAAEFICSREQKLPNTRFEKLYRYCKTTNDPVNILSINWVPCADPTCILCNNVIQATKRKLFKNEINKE